MLQGCCKGVARVLQGCYKGICRVLPECCKSFTSVTRLLIKLIVQKLPKNDSSNIKIGPQDQNLVKILKWCGLLIYLIAASKLNADKSGGLSQPCRMDSNKKISYLFFSAILLIQQLSENALALCTMDKLLINQVPVC